MEANRNVVIGKTNSRFLLVIEKPEQTLFCYHINLDKLKDLKGAMERNYNVIGSYIYDREEKKVVKDER